MCRVVLEQSAAYTAGQQVADVTVGQDAVFTLTPAAGWTLTGTDNENAVLEAIGGGAYRLTVPQVRYTVCISVTAEQSAERLFYHANGGQRLDGGDADAWVEQPVSAKHLRRNTSQGADLFVRQGHTLMGWNTAADGSGTAVGLGSRAEAGAHLYAQWAEWNDAEEFDYTLANGAVTITGWRGAGESVVVPSTLGGAPVTVIASGAFAGADCRSVVLPSSLRRIESDAFAGSAVEEVTLFDSLVEVSGYAFRDCESLQTLHINAATAPVYAASYYATFADKYDRLSALADAQKLVLFSGSSTRFGYDSAALDAAFPAYEVVNMGVFAYTNALPQLDLIADCLAQNDVLLLSPEFDAAKRQFCTTNALDEKFFCLIEENYDLAAALDLRRYTGVFAALDSYLDQRAGLTAGSYELSPADYDEDGSPVTTPSYNEYGDYALYRPNAADDTPIYGLAVPYTTAAFPQSVYIQPFNAVCEAFRAEGVRVMLTYSPRNREAVSADSTPEAIAALDAYFRSQLTVPVLTPLEGSLMAGRYFYGTDNHLSTDGVAIRTAQVIEALQKEGM